MDKIAELDSSYEQFMNQLPKLVPEGVVEVDLKLLQKLGLLNEELASAPSPQLTRYFHVIESKDKITLFNDQFAIWVVPEKLEDEPSTLVLIALSENSKLRLELAFSTSGIYNTSRLVLRILERFLSDIQETEDLISHLEDHAQ
jgi:hypothetical protein